MKKSPMNRRELFTASTRALLASSFLFSSRNVQAQGATLTRDETTWDNKRKQLISKLTEAKPYALVVNMDFTSVIPLTIADLASKVNELSYVTTEHVPYFAQLATNGKIAAYKDEARIAPPGKEPVNWMAATQLDKNTKGYFISVRKTGQDSLKRIGEGHPTKPHAILDKSLKPGSVGNLSTLMTHLRAQYAGKKLSLVATDSHKAVASEQTVIFQGVEKNTNELVTHLEALWQDAGFSNAATCPYFGMVGWWVTVYHEGKPVPHPDDVARGVEKPKSLKVPVGYLRVGDIGAKGQAKIPSGVPKAFAKGATVLPDAYTGDYDLHDVFYGSEESGFQRRPFLSTDQTLVAPAVFKKPVGEKEYDTFARLLNWSIQRRRNIVAGSTAPGTPDDGYANVVQHGSQNVYYAFIKEIDAKVASGRIPPSEAERLEESLLSWDTGGILFFTPDGIAYIFTAEPFISPKITPEMSVTQRDEIQKKADNQMIPLLQSFHRIYNLHKSREVGFQLWSTNGLIDRIKPRRK